ncbi:MAG: hypothetical protein OHK0046_40740 [Anaerolineae bacterium]
MAYFRRGYLFQKRRLRPEMRFLNTDSLRRNPIFTLAARRHPYLRHTAALHLHSLTRILWVLLPVVLIWVIIIGLVSLQTAVNASINNPYNSSIYTPAYIAGARYTVWLLIGGVALMVVQDVVAVVVSISTVRRTQVSNNTDLMRLTSLSSTAQITAKHGIAQLLSWRVMLVAVGVRCGLMIIYTLQAAYIALNDAPGALVMTSRLGSDLLELLLDVVLFVLLNGVYILEPFWRLRAMTALGINTTSRANHPNQAFLTGFGGMAAIWAGVIALVVMEYMVVLVAGRFFFDRLDSIPQAVFQFILPLSLVPIAVSIFLYYHLLTRWMLRRAMRAVEQVGQ